MSSINSVSSSQSSAMSQYQEYLSRLKAAKQVADAPQDTAKTATNEQQTKQVDGDRDGD